MFSSIVCLFLFLLWALFISLHQGRSTTLTKPFLFFTPLAVRRPRHIFCYMLTLASTVSAGPNLTCEVATLFFSLNERNSVLLLLLWRRTDFVLQWPVFQPQKQQLVHVECWQSAPFLEMGVKRSLFNVPMFTNTELMKAGPHLLNYVCSITQSTSAITAFLCFWLPQQCLCREGKTHILFFGCCCFVFFAQST